MMTKLIMYSIDIYCEKILQCKFELPEAVLRRRPATLSKRDSNTVVFLLNYEIFQNIFFYRTPQVAASELHVMPVFGEGVYLYLSPNMDEVVAEACSSKVRYCSATQLHLC